MYSHSNFLLSIESNAIVFDILFLLLQPFCGLLFVFRILNKEKMVWWSFILGNAVYYMVGITIADRCKDKRALMLAVHQNFLLCNQLKNLIF